jgi:putative FmdB family regulatory protein
MPVYEYICQNCQKVTEYILMAVDPRPTKCPECGGRLHKRISAPAIQFKGSGWYVTDYAKRPADAAKPAAPAADGASPAGERKDAPTPPPTAKESPTGPSAPKKDPMPSKKDN